MAAKGMLNIYSKFMIFFKLFNLSATLETNLIKVTMLTKFIPKRGFSNVISVQRLITTAAILRATKASSMCLTQWSVKSVE